MIPYCFLRILIVILPSFHVYLQPVPPYLISEENHSEVPSMSTWSTALDLIGSGQCLKTTTHNMFRHFFSSYSLSRIVL